MWRFFARFAPAKPTISPRAAAELRAIYAHTCHVEPMATIHRWAQKDPQAGAPCDCGATRYDPINSPRN